MPTTTTLRDRLEVKSPAQVQSFLNILIYGPPGVGKTYFAGTAQDHPETSPVLILDIEGGTTTLRHRQDIDVVRIESIAQMNEVYEMLVTDTEGYYKTIVLDSLTEFQALDIQDILVERNNKRPDLIGEPASMREWGITLEHVRKLVRAIRDLPYNTIITALDKVDKDDNGVVSILPALSGQAARSIPGFLDIVGYMTTYEEDGKTGRQLQTQKTRRVIAKDRTGVLDPIIENPSVPSMFEKITEGE